jgi:hypothetical protein
MEALEVSGKRHWSECSHERGIFARMMVGLAADHGERKTVMIDATYLKAHRTATSMGVKKGAWTPDPLPGRALHSNVPRGGEPRAA